MGQMPLSSWTVQQLQSWWKVVSDNPTASSCFFLLEQLVYSRTVFGFIWWTWYKLKIADFVAIPLQDNIDIFMANVLLWVLCVYEISVCENFFFQMQHCWNAFVRTYLSQHWMTLMWKQRYLHRNLPLHCLVPPSLYQSHCPRQVIKWKVCIKGQFF